MGQEYTFGLCLSHDVDRIYKTYQYLFQAVKQRSPKKLIEMFSAKNPYWTFEKTMTIEERLGVRSSFNFLDEIHISQRPKSDWFSLEGWRMYAGRYDIEDPQVLSLLRLLDTFGWEIGLHGSYTSSENPNRFRYEKERIESAAGTTLVGNRQHYWNLSQPETWRHLQEAGIKYDMSLGSSTETEFQHGYELLRPFDDEFVVFPWSLMDGAVMNAGETTAERQSTCIEVLEKAKEHRSVIVADWHAGNAFCEQEYPGWADMYEWLITKGLEMGAWIGPPGEFYDAIPHPDGTIDETLNNLNKK